MPRRRLKGLSRDELASLIGIGSSYYAWIEQGRPINISSDVRERMAEVLKLDRTETAYLEALCDGVCEPEPLPDAIASGLELLFENLTSLPAAALNRCFDVIAVNPTVRRLLPAQSHSHDEFERNLLWGLFVTASGSVVGDRFAVHRRFAGAFRSAFARNSGSEGFQRLVRALTAASDEFAAAWADHEVCASLDGPLQYQHPELGPLAFEIVTLEPAAARDVVVALAVPDAVTRTILRATS